MPIMLGRPAAYHGEWTLWIGASWVPSFEQDPNIHLKLQKDLFEEGFGNSLQVAAMEFKKLWKPKVTKIKGGYSSDTSPLFQSWLKDVWLYVLESSVDFSFCCIIKQLVDSLEQNIGCWRQAFIQPTAGLHQVWGRTEMLHLYMGSKWFYEHSQNLWKNAWGSWVDLHVWGS